MHIYGPIFVVYMDSPMKYEKWIGNDVTCYSMSKMDLSLYDTSPPSPLDQFKYEMDITRPGSFGFCAVFIVATILTLLPFVMMYCPVGLLITIPFFEISVGRAANFVGASLAVYPSLEPLIALFCIKEFRITVFCCSSKSENNSPGNGITMFTRTLVQPYSLFKIIAPVNE
ncbi:unnamed protein product [Caenorhabditis nigoni]